jgi:hypothetical protein
MMTITQEQIDEASLWERKLAEGGCNLNDALYMIMSSGAPVPRYVLDRYEMAIDSYNNGECSDLADAFGFAHAKKTKNVMLKYLRRLHVKDLVDYYNELGHPLSTPIKGSATSTAFDKVAEQLDLNAEHVIKEYYASKK